MKNIIVLAVMATLTGCAIVSKDYLPDGSVGYKISCDGTVVNWSHCISKAGDICKERGYTLLGYNGEGFPVSAYNSQGNAAWTQQGGSAGYNSSGFSGTIVSRSMWIKCND